MICTEVGQNQMWACQYVHITEPRTWVSSGGLGTMGFGLPAAMGAKLGMPDHLVIDIAGDGSIQMNSQEMATCKINDIPVKVIVLNNGYLGHGPSVAGALLRRAVRGVRARPGLPRLRQARRGLWLARPASLRPGQARGDAPGRRSSTTGPAMVDVRVARLECVFPMVAPGGSIDEMLGGVPGCPVSEMLDDDILEEVWE